MNSRVAVLVIHGMGSQKPYETVDQFARGVENCLSSPDTGSYHHELRFRQHEEDPTHQQKAWTQAYVRLTPVDLAAAGNRPALIDIVEYYWAPIINDRVSALQSLRFLIQSALSPFQYLRANALVIDQVSDESLQLVVIRELARSCFIFFPFIVLLAGLYALIAQPLLQTIAHASNASVSNWFPYFWACSSFGWVQILVLTLVAFRWLLILMTILYFLDAVRHLAPAKFDKRNIRLCDLTVFTFLLFLIAIPFFWHAVQELLPRIAFLNHESTAPAALSSLDNLADNFRHFVHRYLAFAPRGLRLIHITLYLLLGALIYGIKQFLTTAIGGLAVYLGSDSLSKNFAARSQILSECTATIHDLLAQHADLPAATGMPQQYDRLILAAHSLGTVIAYDTLNDLRVKEAAERDQQLVQTSPTPSARDLSRITGLFTFGCPLNKVYYFFRARTGEKTTILNQVLYSLHNFRLRTPPPEGSLPPEPPGNKPFCFDFSWINVWCRLDMISGPMLFYQANQNELVHQGFEPAGAHTGYWSNSRLYTYFSKLLETKLTD